MLLLHSNLSKYLMSMDLFEWHKPISHPTPRLLHAWTRTRPARPSVVCTPGCHPHPQRTAPPLSVSTLLGFSASGSTPTRQPDAPDPLPPPSSAHQVAITVGIRRAKEKSPRRPKTRRTESGPSKSWFSHCPSQLSSGPSFLTPPPAKKFERLCFACFFHSKMVDTLKTLPQIGHNVVGFRARKSTAGDLGRANRVKAFSLRFDFVEGNCFSFQNAKLASNRPTHLCKLCSTRWNGSSLPNREKTFRIKDKQFGNQMQIVCFEEVESVSGSNRDRNPKRMEEEEEEEEEGESESSSIRGRSRNTDEEVKSSSIRATNHKKVAEGHSNVPTIASMEKRYGERKFHFLEERDEEILSKRMLSLSRSNKVRSLLELYLSMEISGLHPSVHAYNSLISCLLRNKLLDDALRVFDRMCKKDMVSGHTYSLIIKAVAVEQGFASALDLFEELDREGKLIHGCDIIFYNTMITICGKMKDWKTVEKLWKKLKRCGCKETAVTYRLLVSTFVRCDQTELALDAVFEIIQNGWKLEEDVLKGIISSCAKDGKWVLALKFLNQMLDDGITPNLVTYNAVINCLGRAGEVDRAFKIYGHMKSSGVKDDTYTWNALLTAFYRVKRYVDALRLFERLSKDNASEMNSHLYNIVLMSCQKLGHWEKSLQLLWQMEALGMDSSTLSYNHAIGACEAARKPDVALQVYQHMIRIKCTPDTFTYLSLIRACIAGSLWNEVEGILDFVDLNASLYNVIIQTLCSHEKISMAKKLYSKMRSQGLHADGKTRALMLQHLAKDTSKQFIMGSRNYIY